MYQYEQFFLKALVLWDLEHCQLHWKCCIFSVGELCCSVLSFLLRGDTSLVLLVRMIIQAQEGTQHSQLFSSLWLFVKLKQDTCSCLASAWPLERKRKKKKTGLQHWNKLEQEDWLKLQFHTLQHAGSFLNTGTIEDDLSWRTISYLAKLL